MKNWKNNLINLKAYEAGEQVQGEDVIKLNANENPYSPSPAVKKALDKFEYDHLKKYPDMNNSFLNKAIAGYYGVQPESIFTANSSDEVLGMSFRAFFNSEHPILFPDITYSFYPVWSDFFNIKYDVVPLNKRLEINICDYNRQNGGIIIPNPNAPTGLELSLNKIDELVKNNQGSVVIIDEAYGDFGHTKAEKLIDKYENLLITKTTSKSRSLAGLRVGYAIGSKTLIDTLNTAMNSFNAYPLSTLSMALAKASFEDKSHFNETVSKIIATRDHITKELRKRGFILTDSKTNFLFITHNSINAFDLYKYLYNKKILVRYFNKKELEGYIRVSIGTDDQMNSFLKEVDNYMEEYHVI